MKSDNKLEGNKQDKKVILNLRLEFPIILKASVIESEDYFNISFSTIELIQNIQRYLDEDNLYCRIERRVMRQENEKD